MAAKEIQVSSDGGVTFHVLPGSTGTMQISGTEIDDTILGQTFQSNQPGMLDWNVTSDAFYKGFAGYKAVVSITGASTTMTGEAAGLVSGLSYQITLATHRILDPDVPVVVYDATVAVAAANIESIDYLTGTITFIAGYTVTAPITVDGAFLPATQIVAANTFTLTMTAQTTDKTDFISAQGNNGFKSVDYGLRTVSLNLTGFHSSVTGYFGLITARTLVVIEVQPAGTDDAVAIGFFKPKSKQQQGNVGALEQDDMDFSLYVPSSNYLPFEWTFSATTNLSLAIQDFLKAWVNNTKLDVKYLQDPAAVVGQQGYSGSGVVTEATLKGGLDVMNEFTVHIEGDGAATQV